MTTASQPLPCLVCGAQLQVRLAQGRKSGKHFVMVICGRDGRHFRGFISDREYVGQVLDAAAQGQQETVSASSQG